MVRVAMHNVGAIRSLVADRALVKFLQALTITALEVDLATDAVESNPLMRAPTSALVPTNHSALRPTS